MEKCSSSKDKNQNLQFEGILKIKILKAWMGVIGKLSESSKDKENFDSILS